MKKTLTNILICIISFQYSYSQNFGSFPKLKKEKLLNDLEILYQGLDKFHSGMYWYTPKDSVDIAFQTVRKQITNDLNVLEFHKLTAPLVALSREDHTNIYLPKSILGKLKTEARYLPFKFVFLGKEFYCVHNGSDFKELTLEGKQIEYINGESPMSIADKLGKLFASDGYIKTVKLRDLGAFNFSKYYFYYFGQQDQFEIKFKDYKEPVIIKSLSLNEINEHLRRRYKNSKKSEERNLLEYKVLTESIAYLGIHSFDNEDIKDQSIERDFKSFLRNSFKSIDDKKIKTLVIDMSKNSGGTEGNEGLLYSYLGDNYQKYKKVRVKTQTAVLDNGVDKPIKLKAFGFWERIFANKKNKDGSLERKEGFGHGLMAYKKEPTHKFNGKTYVIISPATYSAGSEFSNMIYTNDLATFVGQETGGGYLGNTSGYSEKLVLPNSKIEIYIPTLQFIMNVKPNLPIGRGVIPNYEVIPTFEEYINKENASLKYILEELENEK